MVLALVIHIFRLEHKEEQSGIQQKLTEYLLEDSCNDLLAAEANRGAGEVLVREEGVQSDLIV